MNIRQNRTHIDQNTYLQTPYETLLQTNTYPKLTLPNLWRVTNVVFGGVSFGLKKGRASFFDEL